MNARPVYLDLRRIRLPLPGVISFAHRVAGIVLFIGIPFALYVLELSLSSNVGFSKAHDWLASPWLAPFLLLVVWSLCHHLLAGIRFLFMDIDVGVDKCSSHLSAAWVGGLALVIAGALLLEFYL